MVDNGHGSDTTRLCINFMKILQGSQKQQTVENSC